MEKSQVMRAIQTFDNSPIRGVLPAIADRLSSPNTSSLMFSEAFQEILRKYEVASQMNVEDPLDAVAIEVEEQASRPTAGLLSTEFLLNLVIVLLLFFYSQLSINESEQRILNRIERFEDIVTQHIAQLSAHENIDTFYVVKRTLNLRIRSNTKSKVIAILYPGLKVRLIERGSKWIKIEYFDYLEGVHKSGWVYKKYLIIINPKKARR
jgi:hypothetical protein